MEGEKYIEPLNSIQAVETPSHLYEQILARMDTSLVLIPRRFILAACAAVLLLISVNIVLIQKNNSLDKTNTNIVQSMELETDNYLYRYD